MAHVEFTDNTIQVQDAISDKIYAVLEECAAELEAQAARNTRVDTGQTKGNWQHVVAESENTAYIGNPLENAIWEEFGTGEYALEGDGRKGGWTYKDEAGEWHYTHGKKPNRALWNAYNTKKAAIKAHIEEELRGL